ncbi:MAG TPA: polymer-forming cytoskeletal protein [Candidatus Hydrogenedentes bacterium]|nr:polymer-forming cytoskeletal protein [Candidatus Hydrogenedentota bacterium]
MAIKSVSPKYNENRIVTLLGPGCRVTGDIACPGTIRVDGEVQGNVSSEDSIVVSAGAVVHGNLRAGRIIVAGQVHGNITALERIELQRAGQVLGDISAPRVSIQEGVAFEGACVMRAEEQSA